MGDTGGKSGRRPGRHLQVEASGPGNAASVQQRLAGRFGGDLTRRNCRAGPGSKVDAPEASSGPEWKIQEVSRVGAQGLTSKSKLLARVMPDLHTGGSGVNRNPSAPSSANVTGTAAPSAAWHLSSASAPPPLQPWEPAEPQHSSTMRAALAAAVGAAIGGWSGAVLEARYMP